MKTKTEQMYAAMSPWRLFFIVAMPGMVSMFAMSIYSIIEGIFIGQTLGEGAFAAVNIAMPLVMINFSLADLIGVGASAPISIALGKNDHETANNVFSCSVIMIFFVSVLMGGIMFFAAVPLARLMGADDVLLEDTADGVLPPMADVADLEDLGGEGQKNAGTDQQDQAGHTPDDAVNFAVDTFNGFEKLFHSFLP